MRFFIVAALMLCGTGVYAQQSAIELVRQDFKTQKVAILTASLPLSEKESEAFWPIYREYSNELSKLGDRRIAVLKELFEKYDKMDEESAGRLVKESFSIAENRTSLLEKYYKKVAKAVGTVTAARFVQVESQILTIVDAQFVDQVPLIKTAPPGEKK